MNDVATDNQTIAFKEPLLMVHGLDTALEKEKEKYKKCPVKPDMAPYHETVQGWGYVVTGYFLLESAFKALLSVRGKRDVPRIHSFSALFEELGDTDKVALREYYNDYKAITREKIGAFPFDSLDDFLRNLDGDGNVRGNHKGSLIWRYYLTEEKRGEEVPLVSVDYLHEMAYGCIRIVEHVRNEEPELTQHTISQRLYRQRERKYLDWLTVRMNSEGWEELGNRCEILWGPDYRGRYDLYFSKGKYGQISFSEIPDDSTLPVIDKRKEIESFDVQQGYRSIGVTWTSPR